jgi:hypothetical protein
MKKLITICAVVGMVLVVGGVAQANTVNWATGGAYMENLSNTADPTSPNYGWNTNCDKVTLDAASGSLDLVLGTPQIVVVNPLSFEIGWTGDMTETETKSNVYTLTRDITVNGITKSLIQTITHGVTYYQDSLMVNAGAPVAFGNIIVTPLGWTATFSGGEGLYTQTSPTWHTISPVSAEFSLVPEPATMCLLGLGVLLCRKFKKA